MWIDSGTRTKREGLTTLLCIKSGKRETKFLQFHSFAFIFHKVKQDQQKKSYKVIKYLLRRESINTEYIYIYLYGYPLDVDNKDMQTKFDTTSLNDYKQRK